MSTDLTRREMFNEIRKLCAPNNYTNWLTLLREYLVFALTVATAMTAYHWIVNSGYSLGWMVPIYLATVVVIGVWSQNRLACLVHESSHYSLFKNRTLNDVAGNLLVAFPFFGVISNYRIGHWGHHRHVNDPEKDPDLMRLEKHHPRQFPISKRRFVWEHVILQFMPHKAFTYILGRAKYVAVVMKHRSVRNQDPLGPNKLRALRISYYVVLFGTLAYFGCLVHYVLFWIVPFVTVYPATLYLREIAHHGNYPDNGDYTNSRAYEGYWLEREIFFPFSEQNHVIHHMFPTVPWHKMRDAHSVLMRYEPYRENVIVCDGFFFRADAASGNPTVLDLLAAPSPAQLRANGRETQQSDSIRDKMSVDVGGSGEQSSEYQHGES
ncbi:MAG: fatty acid desaturase [Planctomycetota bacterium]